MIKDGIIVTQVLQSHYLRYSENIGIQTFTSTALI